MGRPRRDGSDEERITTAVRIPKSLFERLMEVAAERDTSMNHLLCKGAARYLDKLPPLEPEDS